MIRTRRSLAFAVLLAGPMALLGPARAAGLGPSVPASPDDATIVHVLNRLTFGARPADVERVKHVGLSAWIESQLRPAASEDKPLATRLASLPTLSMPVAELREKYEVPVNLRRDLQKARAEREEAAKQGQANGGDGMAGPDPDSPMARRAEREAMTKQFPELARLQGRPQQVVAELQSAKVLRAVYAERQLEEVMVDFWFNHFNVFARKGPIEFMVGEYEQTIRKHALGKFEDLLVATAKSPAMLFYLDNWQSTDPDFSPFRRQNNRRANPQRAGRPGRSGVGVQGRPRGGQMTPQNGMPQNNNQAPQRRTFGINENYARELMELHTLGVEGGYTQADVVEVAKAFTGWTIRGEGPGGPRQNKESRFSFEEARHVKGDKVVLGLKIRNGGEREGLEILHLLATRPSTAKFIATKLVRRLVADDPPKALVLRAAATFEKTGGDIREVLRTIVTSEEFLGPAFRTAKVKTPLDFVASAVRATGAEVTNARALAQSISDMGMPLYLQQPPTGYKDTAEEWISTSALLERMNFALDLSENQVRGVNVSAGSLSGPGATLDSVAARILPAGLSPKSRATLEEEAAKANSSPTRLVGLVLGSPEFQKR